MLRFIVIWLQQSSFVLKSFLPCMPMPIAAPSVLPVEMVGRAKKRLRKPMEPGEMHIKECAQELCISFLKNAVQPADT